MSKKQFTQARSAGASPVTESRRALGANNKGVLRGSTEAVRSHSEPELKPVADADKAVKPTCQGDAAQKPPVQLEIVQLPGCLPTGCTLDSMLTPAQFICWQQVSETWFKSRKHKLPGVIRRGRNLTRVHPRTYLERSVK